MLALVFLRMTWYSGDLGPTVVALWMESLLAMVPVMRVNGGSHTLEGKQGIPGFLKTVPKDLRFNERKLKRSGCM